VGRAVYQTNQQSLNAVADKEWRYYAGKFLIPPGAGQEPQLILPLFLVDVNLEVPGPWIFENDAQVGQQALNISSKDLPPPRLPRLSVAEAGKMMARLTGLVGPDREAVHAESHSELKAVRRKAIELLDRLQLVFSTTRERKPSGGDNSAPVVRMVDASSGRTIGQIISPPLPGSDVVLALTHLDAVGLADGPTDWSCTNHIHLVPETSGGNDGVEDESNRAVFRYLPYRPLWFPQQLDPSSGKVPEKEDDSDEYHDDDDSDYYDDDEDYDQDYDEDYTKTTMKTTTLMTVPTVRMMMNRMCKLATRNRVPVISPT
jgi:hypothetical protein